MQQETFVNHYQTLQVHPAAPLDLITAAYWHLVGSGPSANGDDESAAAVHQLSKAYAVLADPSARVIYDRSIELEPQPLVPKLR
ncbi:MAG: DnaJ domain-containing protein, partial [Chloroflexi bacterium]|nr:DnaJ domain-containing protein [Chloroflexota bacterium]